jgi:hypothetical protein
MMFWISVGRGIPSSDYKVFVGSINPCDYRSLWLSIVLVVTQSG